VFERFTDTAKRVLVLAQEESRLLGHGYIGTEHLLLGLLHDAEPDDGTALALAAAGATLAAARRRLQRTAESASAQGHIPFTGEARRALEVALPMAVRNADVPIDRRHLLAGVLERREGAGVWLLTELEVDVDALAAAVDVLVAGNSPGQPPPAGGLHPQARSYLAAAADPPTDLEGMRHLTSETSRRYAGVPVDLPLVRDTTLNGVPCRIYSAGTTTRPGVVQIHGGGWVTGDLDSQDVTCRLLAAQSGWAIVAVDFRRSPEYPYPAALEDVLAVTAALRAGADAAVDPYRLAVLGDSAGGNLAAVAARRLRDAGEPGYELQVLIYPVTDAAMDTPSYRRFAEAHGLTAAAMKFYFSAYAPPDLRHPDVSPLRAPDLSGLPPAYVVTAEFDPLRDEGEAYAAALAAADVPVTARRYLGCIHGFWRLPGHFDAGRAAVSDVAGALRALGF